MSNTIDNITSDVQTKTDVAKPRKRQRRSTLRPGRLTGSIPLTIHTVAAQRLFSGYMEKETLNVLQFAAKMADIWAAAERDDPYADWYLLNIYESLTLLNDEINQVINDYQQQLNAKLLRLDIANCLFVSEKPITASLWFRTQYGYLAANIVAAFDELMRLSLTANRIGVAFDKPVAAIRDTWSDKLLAVFNQAKQWQDLTLTRSTLSSDDTVKQQAEKAMGVLPDDVLTRKYRSPFSPDIVIPSNIEETTP